MTTQAPSADALTLIAALSPDRWLTEAEVDAVLVDRGVTLARPLRSVLGEARRRSWLLRNQQVAPAVYRRTGSGTLAALSVS